MKKCSTCKTNKSLSEFNKNKCRKDGYANRCKNCFKEYRTKNKDKIFLMKQKYRNENKEKIAQTLADYYLNNKDTKINYNKNYYTNNKQKIQKQKREYETRPETINLRKARFNTRYYSDINFKLKNNLRARLRLAIKRGSKLGSSVRDLGCSIEKLKLWLEMHWQDGMSWDNYGPKGWHIDHIIPLASLDLTNKEQFLKAVHFTNLQPLWAEDNYDKKDKLEWLKH